MIGTIKVLDHGYVKLVATMGTDEDVVAAARMSTGRGFVDWNPYQRCKLCDRALVPGNEASRVAAEQSAAECDHFWEQHPGDAHMLTTMYRDGHTSPFEMCELAIEVQAPLFVFREWHRHRTQSYSELSARYTQMPNLHYVPEMDRFRPKASKNKQESSLYVATADASVTAETMREFVEAEQIDIYDTYETLLQNGAPKEVARVNTPVSRYSRMRAKANLLNWFRFLNLRMRKSAQWEIRQYADAVASIVAENWPRSYTLFEEYDLRGMRLSCFECEVVRRALEHAVGVGEIAVTNSVAMKLLDKLEGK